MVGLILGILLLIGGIAAGIFLITKTEDGHNYVCQGVPVKQKIHPYAKYSGIAFGLGVVLCVGLIFCGCIASVKTGHTGVVTTFGKVENYTLDAGFHTKAPWQSLVQMDNRVQKASVDMACFSKDIQEVNCKYTLNYQISKADAQDIYRTIGKEYYDTVITPNVSESVKTIMAHYTAEELIGSRDSLAAAIEELLGKQLEKYHIEVVSTAIEDLDFTDAFTDAVEAKQVAQQNKLKAATEQEQKTMEAQQAAARAKIQAEADAEVAKIQAQADMEVAKIGADSAEYQGRKEASIALQRLASINGWTVVSSDQGINELFKPDGSEVTAEELAVGSANLIKYYYTQAWDGVLPQTYLGGDEEISKVVIP